MKKYNEIDKYKDVVYNALKVHLHHEFYLTKSQETKLRPPLMTKRFSELMDLI